MTAAGRRRCLEGALLALAVVLAVSYAEDEGFTLGAIAALAVTALLLLVVTRPRPRSGRSTTPNGATS